MARKQEKGVNNHKPILYPKQLDPNPESVTYWPFDLDQVSYLTSRTSLFLVKQAITTAASRG